MNNRYTLTSVAIVVGLILIPAPTEAQSINQLSSMLDQARTQLMEMLDSLNGGGQDVSEDATASETLTPDQNETESDTDDSVVTTDQLDEKMQNLRELIRKQSEAQNDADDNTTYDAGSGLNLSSDNAFSVTQGANGIWNTNNSDDFYYSGGRVGIGTSSPSATLSVAGDISADSITATGTTNFEGLTTFESGYVSQASSTVTGDFTADANATTTGAQQIGADLNVDGTTNLGGVGTFENGFVSQSSSTVADTLTTSGLGTFESGFITQSSSTVSGGLTVSGNATTTGEKTIEDTLDVTNLATFAGGFVSQSSSTVADTFTASGLSTFESGYISNSSSTIEGDLTVDSNATTTGAQYVGGETTLDSTLALSGVGTLESGFVSKSSSTVADTFTASGLSTFESGFLSQASSTIGDGTQSGGLTVSGGATTTGDQLVEGTLTTGGTINADGDLITNTTGNDLKLEQGSNSDQFVLDTSGNVGLGTSSPEAPLHVPTDDNSIGVSNIGNADILVSDLTNGLGIDENEIFSEGNELNIGTLQSKANRFFTNGNERMTISGSGDIGIGSSTPSSKLTIEDSGNKKGMLSLAGYENDNEFNVLELVSEDGQTTDFVVQQDSQNNSLANVGIGIPSPTNRLDVEGAAAIGSNYSGNKTAPTDGAIIEGNVGIGTSSPSANLEIQERSGQSEPITQITDSSANTVFETNAKGITMQNDNAIEFNKDAEEDGNVPLIESSGNALLLKAPINNVKVEDQGGSFTMKATDRWEVPDGFGFKDDPNTRFFADFNSSHRWKMESFNSIRFTTDTGSSEGGPHNFDFNRSGSFTTEGNVGVGTTSPNYRLHVATSSDGAVAGFTDSNGTCTVDPTSTSLSCSSDRRLKDDISKLSSSTILSNIQKLSAVTYRWDSQEEGKQYGFIAQDVEDVYPEFVSEGANGYKKISYSSFIPVAIEGIKQLDLRLNQMEAGTTSVERLINDDSFVKKVATAVTDILKQGTQTFQTLVAQKRVRAPELCAGSTCVTESQLKKLLEEQGVAHKSHQTYESVTSTQQREEDSQGEESDEQNQQKTDTASSTPNGEAATTTPQSDTSATSTAPQTNVSSTNATNTPSTEEGGEEGSTSTAATDDTDTGTSTQETSAEGDTNTNQPATSTPPTDSADDTQAEDEAPISTDSQ